MSPTTKPSFILIPGAFCPASYYHKVVNQLKSQGYEALALDLPSFGDTMDKPAANGYDDAAFVRSQAQELLDQDKDVILVANSYGGFVITEASKGLSKADREAAGKPGGAVLHLVYLASFLTPVGKTVHDMVGAYAPTKPLPPASPDDDWIIPVGTPEMGGKFFCGSLSPDEQVHYGAMARPHSAKAFADPLTYAGYEYIPTTCVIGENDIAYPVQVQHDNIDEMINKGVGSIKKVVLEGDHVIMLSSPEEVVRICVDSAQ